MSNLTKLSTLKALEYFVDEFFIPYKLLYKDKDYHVTDLYTNESLIWDEDMLVQPISHDLTTEILLDMHYADIDAGSGYDNPMNYFRV